MKWKLLTTLLILLILSTSTASAAAITPTKEQVTQAMADYDLNNQNNSYSLACEIGQYVSEEYGWNCDIREITFSNHTPIYIDVFYPAADNKKGYEAYYGWFGPQKKEVVSFWTRDQNKKVVMYYKDWDSASNTGCRIVGAYGSPIVKSYFGNVTTDPVEDETVEENTTPDESHGYDSIPYTEIENSTVLASSGNNSDSVNTVKNSSGVINTQGNGNWVQQLKFVITDVKNSTVNFFVNLGQ